MTYEIFNGKVYLYNVGPNEDPWQAFDEACRQYRDARMVRVQDGQREDVSNLA